MISCFNDLLRHLCQAQIAEITSENQIHFEPPDADWQSGLAILALNIYLVDIRENRKLRSNARQREIREGIAYDHSAPPRIDYHYLASAWSSATPGMSLEPASEEQALLYELVRVLMENTPLNPIRFYTEGSPELLAWPEQIRECDIPTQVLPVEGFPKLAEFWGTMGREQPWKPVVYFVVTLPVIKPEQISGPIVTTRITEYRVNGRPETAEIWIQIGGQVLRPNPDSTLTDPLPELSVPDAWVALENSSGDQLQTTTTDRDGRFTFGGLREENYQLRARVPGLGETRRHNVVIPSPTGEYDLHFEGA